MEIEVITKQGKDHSATNKARIIRVPIAFSIILMFSWMILAPSQGEATPMFDGGVTATVQACPGTTTCSVAAGTVVTNQAFQGLSPSPVSVNTNASLPNANASGSLQVNSAGITVNGTAGSTNSVNSPPGGWGGSFHSDALALNSYLLSSTTLPVGTVVTLTAQLQFAATLTEFGGHMLLSLGPYLSYGPLLPENLFPNTFKVFNYDVTAFFSLTTPGSTALTINEVGGVPGAVVTGTTLFTPESLSIISISPNATFPVPFQATIGEPFSFGIAMDVILGGGSFGPGCTVNVPACNGQGTIIDPLSLNSFGVEPFILPANVTIREFSPVPEPSTWLLLASGLVGLILWRKRTA